MNTVIIVAAGSGTRFAGDKPKQFVNILGKPLIFHTLDRFQSCDAVNEIVLVLSGDAIDEFERSQFRSAVLKLKKVVVGGACRAESVKNGLSVVDSNAAVVAVHDGARPLVAVDEIAATLRKADETGAACLVGEVTDTIKSIRGGEIAATFDRTKLRRALTPQAFRADVLRRAFEFGEISDAVTDECYLVERLGHPIHIVEGSSRNIKITRREDVLLAELLLSQEKK